MLVFKKSRYIFILHVCWGHYPQREIVRASKENTWKRISNLTLNLDLCSVTAQNTVFRSKAHFKRQNLLVLNAF